MVHPGESMLICVFCIAEMVKVDNKSSFMQLKSIQYTNAENCFEGIPLRFLASLFDIQMRYLVYMRYLRSMSLNSSGNHTHD